MESLEYLRPISLRNFVNKIFSRLILDKLSIVVRKSISKNQSGFVEDRNTAENVLLTQEIIKYIGKRNLHHNLLIKLDMAKAYDRISWVFLIKVLRKFGFSEVQIDLMWRLLSNN